MSETRINTSFSYDPSRQGYDTNLWKTVNGTPTISGGRLYLLNSGIEHYADLLKGEISFNVNVPDAPGGNDGRLFGVRNLASGAFILFSIGGFLSGTTCNGTSTTVSDPAVWDSSWTGANVNFKIRWEPGTAKFFVNGTQIACITDDTVPYGPLALFAQDSSGSGMTIGSISGNGIQSYVLNSKTADATVYSQTLIKSELITVTESVTITRV